MDKPVDHQGGWGEAIPMNGGTSGDADIGTPEGNALADTPALPSTQTEYEVGYKKPPRHARWKAGQSGNPKGPKKKKGGSIRERVQRLLDREVSTTDGQSMTFSDAILQVAMQGLIGKGGRSAKASVELINFLERFDTKIEFVPTAADESRLNELLQQLGTSTNKGNTDESP